MNEELFAADTLIVRTTSEESLAPLPLALNGAGLYCIEGDDIEDITDVWCNGIHLYKVNLPPRPGEWRLLSLGMTFHRDLELPHGTLAIIELGDDTRSGMYRCRVIRRCSPEG